MAVKNTKPPRRRRGTVVLVAALTTFITFGFTALSVDIGYLYSVQTRLKMACDAAALAGLMGLRDNGPGQARALARAYAEAHWVDGQQVQLQNNDIQFGFWDHETRTFIDVTNTEDEALAGAVRVTTPRTGNRANSVSLFFGPVLGLYEADVVARSTAALGQGDPWDVIIVQDITGSFTEELPDAKEADDTMLDCVAEHTGVDSQMGLVAFTGYGQIMQTLVPLQDGGYEAMQAAVAGLSNCGSGGMPPCSGTNIAPGLELANDLLDSSTSPADVDRAIILVSDGAPNSSFPGITDQDLMDLATAQADYAEAMGYSIWTVFYDQANDPVSQAFMQTLARGNGQFFVTPDSTELPQLLYTVCQQSIRSALVE